VFFCGILFGGLWAVLRWHQRASKAGVPAHSPIAAFLSASIIATAFLLATISLVGHFPPYMWLLCSAFASLPIAEERRGRSATDASRGRASTRPQAVRKAAPGEWVRRSKTSR
jgi:hypothetical protein